MDENSAPYILTYDKLAAVILSRNKPASKVNECL
jgi:hypothetical protein